jgi:hypothetical protein
MTTTIVVQGVSYTIPNDKIPLILDLLRSYRVTETKQSNQVREVLSSHPTNDGRILING